MLRARVDQQGKSTNQVCMNTPQTELAKSLQLEVYRLRAENEELRKLIQQDQTMSQPLRTAYSRKEISKALAEWMIKRWGNIPQNLPPCLQDKYYRENSLICHFIAYHFPTEKKEP